VGGYRRLGKVDGADIVCERYYHAHTGDDLGLVHRMPHSIGGVDRLGGGWDSPHILHGRHRLHRMHYILGREGS